MRNVLILLASTAIATVGCTRQHDQPSGHDHLFLSQAPVDWKPRLMAIASREDCERALAAAVCETTATTREIQIDFSRVACSPDSRALVPQLLKIHDEMPERLRPSLCSLERIFVSDNIPSTAFASPILRSRTEAPIGAYLGFRARTFKDQPTSRQLVTWKEQLPFGGSQEFLANDPKLLQIDYGIRLDVLDRDGLFYVVVHEIGHLLDFHNNVNESTCGRFGAGPECRTIPGTFGALSWSSMSEAIASAKHLFQGEFCYYNCDGNFLAADRALEIYRSIKESAFPTPYAGTNPREDFAEYLAWYAMLTYKGADYRVQVPGQGEIEMTSAFTTNEKMRAKLSFVERLWKSPGLKVDNR